MNTQTASSQTSGSFATGAVASPFSVTGFGAFDNLAAGASFDGLQVLFTGFGSGNFESSIVLHPVGFNASGFQVALADQTLVLRGSVAAVPEPGTYMMLLSGLMLVFAIIRRRSAGSANSDAFRPNA